MNVWQNTTLCDCDMSEKLVQFLIVSDGELKMSWDNTCLLVVTSGVASQLEDLSSQVFENSCEVNWSTSTDSLGVVALSEKSVDTTDWECETSLR